MSREGSTSLAPVEPKSEPVLLKIKIKDQSEGEMEFRIKATTRMGKIFDNYCHRRDVDRSTRRFLFEGHRIQNHDTAEGLDMEDEDMIECVLEQTGGDSTPDPDARAGDEGGASVAADEPKPEEGRLSVKVVDQDHQETFFKIKTITPLSKVMNAYCERQGKDIRSVRFVFEGTRIQNGDTPASLEMEDGDLIQVFLEMQGGEGSQAGDAKEPDPEPQHIQVAVKNDTGVEMAFKLKKITPMKKLMGAFANSLGVAPDTLRFYTPEDCRILPADTAETLELESGDLIDCHLEHIGGDGSMAGDAEESAPVPEHTQLIEKDQGDIKRSFKLMNTTPLKKVIDAFAKSLGVNLDTLRFIDPNGLQIQSTDTAESLDLVTGVECRSEQGRPPDADADPIQKHIEIKAKDDNDVETTYKIKKTTALKKLMNAYAESIGVAPASLRFYDPEGTRIQNDATPDSLALDPGDMLTVHIEQHGGRDAMPDPAQKHIELRVQDLKGQETHFLMRKTGSMRKLMFAFAERNSVPGTDFLASMGFFDSWGYKIQPLDTPKSLMLDNGDLLRCIPVRSETSSDLN